MPVYGDLNVFGYDCMAICESARASGMEGNLDSLF
jgi:hypothetical protein